MAKFSAAEGEGESEGPSNPKKRRREGECSLDAKVNGDLDSGKTISITIDPDVLDCSICMETFVPPVFQCENGHIACSSCCMKLKHKCHSCPLPIGYTRCLAIEKVVESIKVCCRNSRYGCRETLSYSNKPTHEETCLYMPCSCPMINCNFIGSFEQLSIHINSNHWASAIRFRYNCPFHVSLDKNEPFNVLLGEDGLLFIVNNREEHMGLVIAVHAIGPPYSKGGHAFNLVTKRGARSLSLQSFANSATKRSDVAPGVDFLLVPYDFNSRAQLKLEICIWSNRELE
ncbi:E3 ubiquitin-protein ligase SINA-like 10 [Aristolochia californica]|uniref:E3 ubiquitin-protein ligase SINA-like 10 n=1 Tax=Aristolochia californica TaxID=171875 RepID=UPI0035E033F2